MVTILPRPTSAADTIGQALGGGLGEGLQKGSDIGLQRGLLQNALGDLKNLSAKTTPAELLTKVISATAGIPGAERYVGSIYPILLQQLQNRAFNEYNTNNQPGAPQPVSPGEGNLPTAGPTAQDVAGLSNPSSGGPGGFLGAPLSQEDINQRAQAYSQSTQTGIEGFNQMKSHLEGLNQTTQGQRDEIENRAAKLGVPPEERGTFLQLAQRHKYAKTFEDLVRNTERDFKEYKNLSKSLDTAAFPGGLKGFLTLGTARSSELKNLENSVKRLNNLGFEQEVRSKLAEKSLSPTEIEELIHPFSEEQRRAISSFPPAKNLPFANREEGKNAEPRSREKDVDRMSDFFRKNTNPETSLLALRHRFWQDKGYDWQDISKAMNRAYSGDNPPRLSTAQVNELGILENEPPRQSLNFIFKDFGNIFKTLRGEK